MTTERNTAGNSTYKKLAVQWLNEVQFFNQNFVQVDSFVLRNRQLLIAANRYAQFNKKLMIEFEFNESSIFTKNKMFCESILKEFDPEQKHTKGSCSSYGYTINTNYSTSRIQYSFRFEKNQSTQGSGLFFHPNAIDSCEIEIKAIGLNKNFKMSFGKSRLRRITMDSTIKKITPTPFYYSSDGKIELDEVKAQLLFFKTHLIESINIRNGKLKCKIYSEGLNLRVLRKELEMFVENWA